MTGRGDSASALGVERFHSENGLPSLVLDLSLISTTAEKSHRLENAKDTRETALRLAKIRGYRRSDLRMFRHGYRIRIARRNGPPHRGTDL